MEVLNQPLTDAFVLKPKIYEDSRGYFCESFNQSLFSSLTGYSGTFIQDNQSCSKRGSLRGLHYQAGVAAQSKLVRVTKGSAFDVAVDLRPNSPTFKQWHGEILSDTNHVQFFIPRGFAHGFMALEDDTIFQYKVDNAYSKLHEGGILWNDKTIGISWPHPDCIHLSEKDKALPLLSSVNANILW